MKKILPFFSILKMLKIPSVTPDNLFLSSVMIFRLENFQSKINSTKRINPIIAL